MTLNEYQEAARKTAVYPEQYKIIYPAMGLCGEAGETIEKIKKAVRKSGPGRSLRDEIDYAGVMKEMGDTLWYLANLATDLNVRLEVVADINLEKLMDRQKRNELKGEGDNR